MGIFFSPQMKTRISFREVECAHGHVISLSQNGFSQNRHNLNWQYVPKLLRHFSLRNRNNFLAFRGIFQLVDQGLVCQNEHENLPQFALKRSLYYICKKWHNKHHRTSRTSAAKCTEKSAFSPYIMGTTALLVLTVLVGENEKFEEEEVVVIESDQDGWVLA